MSELSKLKKENKRLKSLLKNAVELLNTYKEYLKHPDVGAVTGKPKRTVPAKKKAKKKSANAK